jgi:hypothetical protein
MGTANEKLVMVGAIILVAALLWFGKHLAGASSTASGSAQQAPPVQTAGGRQGTTTPSAATTPHATRAEKKAAARYFAALHRIDVSAERAWASSEQALRPVDLHSVSPAWYSAQPILGRAAAVLHSAGRRVQAIRASARFRPLGHDLAYVYFDEGALLDRYSMYLVVRNASDFSATEPDLMQDHMFLTEHRAAYKRGVRRISRFLGTPPPAWMTRVLSH